MRRRRRSRWPWSSGGPARRAHLVLRAQRAVVRQRPARLPALLHRLPGVPRPHRRRPTRSTSRRASTSRCWPPGAGRATIARTGLARPRCTWPARSLGYRHLSLGRPPRPRAGRCWPCAASTSTTRRSTARRFGAWLAGSRPERRAVDRPVEPDRAADAQRPAPTRPRWPWRPWSFAPACSTTTTAGDIGWSAVPARPSCTATNGAPGPRRGRRRGPLGATVDRSSLDRRRAVGGRASADEVLDADAGDRGHPTGGDAPRWCPQARAAAVDGARRTRRSSTSTWSSTARSPTSPWPPPWTRRCSSSSTAPTSSGLEPAASTWPSRSRRPTTSSAGGPRSWSRTFHDALGELFPAARRAASARRRRQPRARRHLPGRARNGGPAARPAHGPAPGCSWPERGPTPAGRPPWRARSAADARRRRRPTARRAGVDGPAVLGGGARDRAA